MLSKKPGFGKLFKYDAREFFKSLALFYALLFVSAGLAQATSGLSGSFAALFAKGFANGLFISMVATLLINNFIRLMVRVRANMYGAESYLTHALPVKTRSIWLAWWAVGLLSSLLSCVAVAIACLAIYTSFGTTMLEYIEQIAQMLEVAPSFLCAQLGIVAVLEMWTIITVGMLAIVLGQKANNHQVLRAVLWALAIYWVLQVAIIGVMYLLALYNDQLMAVFQNTPITDFNSLTSVLSLATVFYTLAVVATSGTAVACLKRGVNVE